MRQIIPTPLISVCAEVIASRETHSKLNGLFHYAGAPGEPPDGTKSEKAVAWLRIVNKDDSVQPLEVLGRIIEGYMDAVLDPQSIWHEESIRHREMIANTLTRCELQYHRGGKIVGTLGSPSRTLEEYIRDRDSPAIDQEFHRALSNVENSPREAVSAASNILESLCKEYIHAEGIEAPAKQDLKSIWAIVRRHLGFDPSQIEDKDLQTILTGLFGIVEGIGALRTHASSAHGASRNAYRLEPRHARLAIHSAHTVALFILETWKKHRA